VNQRAVPGRLRSWGRELLVVFVGVWLALAAETWRERRAADRRADSIVRAIRADLADLTDWYDRWRDSIGSELAVWETEQRAGRQPPLYYVRIPGSEQGELIGWQVALASGALDVLDPELVFELGRVSREIDGVGERFARYMSLTEVLVFPRMGTDAAAFYHNGALKPEYAAHIMLLKELLREMDEKVFWLKRLDARIANAAKS
jgi:hypothetical protein